MAAEVIVLMRNNGMLSLIIFRILFFLLIVYLI